MVFFEIPTDAVWFTSEDKKSFFQTYNLHCLKKFWFFFLKNYFLKISPNRTVPVNVGSCHGVLCSGTQIDWVKWKDKRYKIPKCALLSVRFRKLPFAGFYTQASADFFDAKCRFIIFSADVLYRYILSCLRRSVNYLFSIVY